MSLIISNKIRAITFPAPGAHIKNLSTKSDSHNTMTITPSALCVCTFNIITAK